MTEVNTYPVKLVSRRAGNARKRQMGLAWVATGLAFGVGCMAALTPSMDSQTIVAQTSATIERIETVMQAPMQIIAANDSEADNLPLSIELKVEKGDSFTSILTDAGASYAEATDVADSIRTIFNPRRLGVGHHMSVQLEKDDDGKKIIRSMKLPISALSTLEVARASDGSFNVKKVDAPVYKKLAHAGGKINSSLYETGVDAGIPPAMINEIINAYSYDVDFQREIKSGNEIGVLFERMETADGTVAGNGNLVYAQLEIGDRELKIYRYTDKSGNADFYNEKGESVRKALLRTPINGAKITSSFGMRNHPILGYTKMHKGVDFGAPTGTPIYAAGDGTVDFIGKKGGYGNYIKIKHNGQYASAYAHVSRFASGMASGKRVKQGQIIAYVGTTGNSTGPHLHYEILADNTQVNPANVKFKTGTALKGKELVAFKDNMNRIGSKLASIERGNSVAMAESDKIGVAN